MSFFLFIIFATACDMVVSVIPCWDSVLLYLTKLRGMSSHSELSVRVPHVGQQVPVTVFNSGATNGGNRPTSAVRVLIVIS
ncbi:hypothetical protein M758_4G071300 [Ceratodon purpureus]|uniref:Secreted protein n=1 Tax=Ceratodon purpureus TaxID=3225 RepID=A0A8T0I7K0_CERPU|nr:hypothetical protein KC19_4G070300 [Ceratodon purpureus]KAG0618526.1 hypothetical protein M758_4G071300 [Ceratodon purpureus]